jgi:hypothetical protein
MAVICGVVMMATRGHAQLPEPIRFGAEPPPAVLPPAPAPAPAPVAKKAGATKYLNSSVAQIDFRADRVGPSGIGRIDIYLTKDGGRTWTKSGEDAGKSSSVSVQLPGEGRYGIRLAVVNGHGFGGHPPKAGDTPQLEVEVDMTSPIAEFRSHHCVAGGIDIRWAASDPNLGSEPISLYYRSRAASEWRTIARNVKNDGSYRWALSPDIEGEVFLKIEATDLAGNVTKVETPMPIQLDRTEPAATVLDVSARSPVTAASHVAPTLPPPGVDLSPRR